MNKYLNNPDSAHQIENSRIFRGIINSVWVILIIYTCIYFYLDAKIAYLSLGFGVFILNPLTIYWESRQKYRLARLLFIVSANFYIFTASLGLGHCINAEYYFVPAGLFAFLLFDLEDKFALGLSLSLPIVCWALMVFGAQIVPTKLIYIPPYPKLFIYLNFFGSFALSIWFVRHFVRVIKDQRTQMIVTAKFSSLGVMASGIAHEINNPLAVINSKIGLLRALSTKGNIDPVKLMATLEKIEGMVLRITKIIKGLRTFSRDSDLDEKQIASIRTIILDTLELCDERIKQLNIIFKLTVPDHFFLNCRPTQISQVIMNLLNNSVDAIADLPEKWIHVQATIKNNKLIISVTDSGAGIPPAVVQKMMNPFFTTKESGRGTGLGLSISKSIIQDHDGDLTYEAQSKNTQFLLTFPISQSVAQAS